MVRIASSGMYFPGTTERAVLVAGETEAVKVRAFEELMKACMMREIMV